MSKNAWPVCLEGPPVIVQMGVAVHGTAEGPSSEEYLLPDLWCLHVYRYEGVLELDGVPFALKPRFASVIQANTRMLFGYEGLSEHLYCHFRLPTGVPNAILPAVQDLGGRASAIDAHLREAASMIGSGSSRRQAAVWDVLWSLANREVEMDQPQKLHPVVEKASKIIERRLGEPISVAQLADEVDVSYGYLSRLFQAEMGETVVGYIRRRRSDRAEHLLRNSTLAIKSIAILVGVPDLQQFNRMIHRSLGGSPRDVRARRV